MKQIDRALLDDLTATAAASECKKARYNTFPAVLAAVVGLIASDVQLLPRALNTLPQRSMRTPRNS